MNIMGIFYALPVEKLHYLLSLEYYPRHRQGVAQYGSVPLLESGGRRFESSHPDQEGDPF
jgi:hypothetical protein